jgi:hypothetical protein
MSEKKRFWQGSLRSVTVGLACGAANGFFGSGGGIIAVPMLESDGLETKKAHATSLAVMLPISIVSAFIYSYSGSLDFANAAKYLPGGLLGAAAGSRLMKRISANMLRRLFGAIMIYFGIRMILR